MRAELVADLSAHLRDVSTTHAGSFLHFFHAGGGFSVVFRIDKNASQISLIGGGVVADAFQALAHQILIFGVARLEHYSLVDLTEGFSAQSLTEQCLSR